MKRRDQGISNAWSFLLGFVLLLLIVPGVLIGPAKAVRIIASAVTTTIMQGPSPGDAPIAAQHQLPTVEIASSGKEFLHNGVRYPIELLPAEGDRMIIRSTRTDGSPFGFDRITLAPPRSADLIGGELALWIAGRMGIPVPWMQLVILRRNGKDEGIHELAEYISSDVERHRKISEEDIPVFRSSGSSDPWRSSDGWESAGNAEKEATALLKKLVQAVNDTLIHNADRRAVIENSVDVDAFIRYHAALQVLGVPDNGMVISAIALSPRTQRFYPILIETPLMPGEAGTIITRENDLLGQRMMEISDWRIQRDRHVRETLQELHVSGAFVERLDELAATVRPSLTFSTGSGRRPLFSSGNAVVSGLQWSADDLRSRVSAYWDRMLQGVAGSVPVENVNAP